MLGLPRQLPSIFMFPLFCVMACAHVEEGTWDGLRAVTCGSCFLLNIHLICILLSRDKG